MGRKPGEITSKHTVVVSFSGNAKETQDLITKEVKRQPEEVLKEDGNTRLVFVFKYHASAEKAMQKVINLNANPSEFRIDNLNASIVG